MTRARKDYNAIAEAIRDVREDVGTVDHVARRVATALHAASPYDPNGNKRFDTGRFLAACGVAAP